MFNEIFGLGYALVVMGFVVLFYRLFGKAGLMVWVGCATVLANIQVTKLVVLFGLTSTLGNALYGSIFLATDILNEKYGRKDAKKAVYLGFSTLLAMVVTMQAALQFLPAPDDAVQPSLEAIFNLIPRIALGSLCAYFISQLADVYLFSKIRESFSSDRTFWIRNNGSTMISQLLDTAIFTSIAFLGAVPTDVWWNLFITTYALKFLMSILGTPFGYLAKAIRPRDER